jgi:hypothetical protein
VFCVVVSSLGLQACCCKHIETEDPGRPKITGQQLLNWLEQREAREDSLFAYLEYEAEKWREVIYNLRNGLDTSNAALRSLPEFLVIPAEGDTVWILKERPPDYVASPEPPCPGCAEPPVPSPKCKIRPDCD